MGRIKNELETFDCILNWHIFCWFYDLFLLSGYIYVSIEASNYYLHENYSIEVSSLVRSVNSCSFTWWPTPFKNILFHIREILNAKGKIQLWRILYWISAEHYDNGLIGLIHWLDLIYIWPALDYISPGFIWSYVQTLLQLQWGTSVNQYFCQFVLRHSTSSIKPYTCIILE